MQLTGPTLAQPSRPILFHVCAWHTPQAELEALNLQYPGQVSHILCPSCAAEFERQCA